MRTMKTIIKTIECIGCQRDILTLPIGDEGTKKYGVKQYSAYKYTNGFTEDWFCSDLCLAQTYAEEFTSIKEIMEEVLK